MCIPIFTFSLQTAAPQPKKQAKAKEQPKAAPTPQAKQPSDSVATKPAPAEERDMSMAAVLGRLATRATQADQIIAHLRTQITAVRQNAGEIKKDNFIID